MKKIQLIHIGLSTFFMITIDKNKTPGVCKDRSNKIMQIITNDNMDIVEKNHQVPFLI